MNERRAMPAFGARHPRFGDFGDVKYIDISRARTRAESIQSIPCPIVARSRAMATIIERRGEILSQTREATWRTNSDVKFALTWIARWSDNHELHVA